MSRGGNGRDAMIVGACRTPIGVFGGALADMGAVDLGAIAIKGEFSPFFMPIVIKNAGQTMMSACVLCVD